MPHVNASEMAVQAGRGATSCSFQILEGLWNSHAIISRLFKLWFHPQEENPITLWIAYLFFLVIISLQKLQKQFGDFSLLVLYVYRHRHIDIYTNTQTFPIKASNRDLKSVTTCQSFWALIFAAREYLLVGLSNPESVKSGNLAVAGKFSFKKGLGIGSLHIFFSLGKASQHSFLKHPTRWKYLKSAAEFQMFASIKWHWKNSLFEIFKHGAKEIWRWMRIPSTDSTIFLILTFVSSEDFPLHFHFFQIHITE